MVRYITSLFTEGTSKATIDFFIELRQDLSEHYADKMVRVEEKVNKLRAAALGK